MRCTARRHPHWPSRDDYQRKRGQITIRRVTTQENAAEQSNEELRREDYRWLTTADAAPWLELAARATQSTVQLTALLRRQLSPTRTHLILEQVELRRSAVGKFRNAAGMFLRPVPWSRLPTSMWLPTKPRFPPGKAVADLCCGIGGDLLAFGARGPVTGVDRDAAIALLAAKNGAISTNLPAAAADLLSAGEERGGESTPSEVIVCDVATFDVGRFAAWHIDPDRRPQGAARRVSSCTNRVRT